MPTRHPAPLPLEHMRSYGLPRYRDQKTGPPLTIVMRLTSRCRANGAAG